MDVRILFSYITLDQRRYRQKMRGDVDQNS
jgi:hypothetical protein